MKSMPAFRLLTVMILIFLAAALVTGCDLPVAPQDEGNADGMVKTSVAGTVAARSSAKGKAETSTPFPTMEKTTEVPDTETPFPVSTMTPTLAPTITPTVGAVQVHVSANTFCRYGPGRSYESLGVLNIDQVSEIVARDPTAGYWYIQNPDGEGECWIWGKYATPEGPTDGFPVYTPPPKPEFVIYYSRSDCGAGSCWLWFTIENTGSIPLESIWSVVETKYTDQGTGDVEDQSVTRNANSFYQTTNIDPRVGTVAQGETVFWHSGQLRNPSGFDATLTVKICSENNLAGVCSNQVYTFAVNK